MSLNVRSPGQARVTNGSGCAGFGCGSRPRTGSTIGKAHLEDSSCHATLSFATGIMTSTANPLTLAAEGSLKVLPVLQAQPALASTQDEHGYSLVHAAASYNHLDLLRALIQDFHVDPNIKDEDGETALFVVETVEAAQILVDELGADVSARNDEGVTAEEKIRMEGDFPVLADFLRECRTKGTSSSAQNASNTDPGSNPDPNNRIPPLPPNIKMQLGTLEDEQSLGEVADPVLRRRIEELASREDFDSEDGQRQLRELITDAVRGTSVDDRNIRSRTE